MTDMQEKVARAIALWVGYMGVLDTMPPGDPGDPCNDAWIERQFRPFLSAAQAAIEAYRVPTDEMLLVGARSIGKTMGTANHIERARACWLAMADAALEGKP